jgi:hypothetical protein
MMARRGHRRAEVRRSVTAVVVAAAFSLPASPAPPGDADDWYPADIAPPPGTSYPCALTPLPRALDGIPPADRRFINHTYSLILEATRAKLLLLKALDEGGDLRTAHQRYGDGVRGALETLRRETPPTGLEAFREDVTAALELQLAYFAKVVAATAGAAAPPVSPPEGPAASRRLHAAWSKMTRRYSAWSTPVRESIYHHLCALDLF